MLNRKTLPGVQETNFKWIPKLKEKTTELRETGEDAEENPTLEVGLLMDCTSSMSSWIVKAKETLMEIVNKVVEECKDEGNLKVRVSFIGYRDITDTHRFAVLPFTEDIELVRQFIQEVKAQGGADTPEDLQGGLQLCLHQDWTEEAAKRVFMIMDAPCHGRKYHDCDDSYPNGSPEDIVMEDLLKEFCKKEIEFRVIKLDNNCNKMIEIMKESHQELEVTDMAMQMPLPQYYAPSFSTYDSFGAMEEGGPAFHDDEKLETLKKSSAMKMRKAAPKKEGGMFSGMMSMFGGSKKSAESTMVKEDMMPASLAMREDEEDMECAPVFEQIESMAPMRKRAPENFEMKQQMEFQSQAISDLTSQVRRKQATVRSKKSMF